MAILDYGPKEKGLLSAKLCFLPLLIYFNALNVFYQVLESSATIDTWCAFQNNNSKKFNKMLCSPIAGFPALSSGKAWSEK